MTIATRRADAEREWLADTAHHRSLLADACGNCGMAAVELEQGGYRCRECGHRPPDAPVFGADDYEELA